MRMRLSTDVPQKDQRVLAPRVRWRARSPVDGVIESEIVVELAKVDSPSTDVPKVAPAAGTP
jgi:hypothetical protein